MIIMWIRVLVDEFGFGGVEVYVVNLGLFLVMKMVKEGFGVVGSDIGIGVDILVWVVFLDEFFVKLGVYFDNDFSCFVDLYLVGMDMVICCVFVDVFDDVLIKVGYLVLG